MKQRREDGSLASRLAIGLGMAAAALAIWGPFRFGYVSFCEECGAMRRSHEKQLPLLDVTYWTSHRAEETVVSRILWECGLVQPHSHRWIFGRGAGNGVQ